MNLAAMYADTRQRLTAVLRSLTPEQLATPVPSTPAWTVGDVARHLAGVADDITAGRVEGAATDPWTAKQVEARQDTPVADVLAEWDEKGPAVEALLQTAGSAAFRLVIDVVTHEQDARGALGIEGGRDTDAAAWCVQQLVAFVDGSLRRNELPPLRIIAGDDEWLVGGEGECAATLRTEPFVLLRGLMGRRSVAQLRALDWEGDPERYLGVLTVFPPAEVDITD